MRIKDLFTVPTGEKVTEKALRKVLISSVCSIMLCMTCLVSTTWAWFAVSIENTGNVIEVATVTAESTVLPVEHENFPIKNEDGSYLLAQGTYTVSVTMDDNAEVVDAFGEKQPVYVSMIISDQCFYFLFSGRETKTTEIIVNDSTATLSFGAASWMKPENADPVGAGNIEVGKLAEEPSSEPTSDPTSEPTAAPTSPSSEPTEEATTEPTTATSEPTEEATTEPTSVSSEPVTEVTTEPTTAFSEPTTEATIEATTEATTEPATEVTT